MRRLVPALLLAFTATASAQQYALEWPGDGATRRMLYWDNPFPIYDATYIFKVYPRKKTVPGNSPTGYYTTFFWGNNGTAAWQGGLQNTYYGAHPYPVPPPNGPGQWEISVNSNDYTTGQQVTWDRWYTQVFRAWRVSPTETHHEFYWDWPDTTKVITTTVTDSSWANKNPPKPAIVVGQAPNLNGQSWGGYPGWEEFNGRIRGMQFYSGLLSLSDVQAELASPGATAAGQKLLWYLNTDPRPTDVRDKRTNGTAHNPAWEGTTALEWISTGTPSPPPPPPPTTPPPPPPPTSTTFMYQLNGASGTYSVLGGAVVKGSMNVRLLPAPSGGTWTFKIDGVSVGTSQSIVPIAMPEDNALFNTATLSEGQHTIAASASGQSAPGPATFTVDNVANSPAPPSPPTQLTCLMPQGVGLRIRLFKSVPSGSYDKVMLAWWCSVPGGWVTHPYIMGIQSAQMTTAANLAAVFSYSAAQMSAEFKESAFTADEQAQINDFLLTSPP